MSEEKIYSLEDVVTACKKRMWSILLVSMAFIAIAVAYVFTTQKLFTATATVFLDKNQSLVVSEISDTNRAAVEDTIITSKIKLLKSQRIADIVLKEVEHQDYLIALGNKDYSAIERILDTLFSQLSVARDGETLIINISYTDESPLRAAKYANAFANAFIQEELIAAQSFSEEGMEWANNQLLQIQSQLRDAQNKVNQYRIKHQLHNSGSRTIDETQLIEINDRLGEAKANSAREKAKYEYSKSIIETGNINAAIAEAFDNDVINNIRNDYISNQKRLSSLRMQLGVEHELVQKLEGEMRQFESVIFNEMKRISESHHANYQVSLDQEKSLELRLDEVLSKTLENNNFNIELQELEQNVETLKTVYQNHLNKIADLSTNQSIQLSETRIVSEAIPPATPSHPKSLLIITLAGILGLGLSLVIAIYLDSIDNTVTSAEQVENSLGLRFIGYQPYIPHNKRKNRKYSLADFEFTQKVYTQSIEQPLSHFAEVCRRTKAFIDRESQMLPQAIGTISINPDEGKTSTAINLARYIAKNGKNCLLLDLDSRNPFLNKYNVEDQLTGLFDHFSRDMPLDQLIFQEKSSNLSILPIGTVDDYKFIDYLDVKRVDRILSELKLHYHYIVIDFPPLGATSDIQRLSEVIDKFVLVVEWNETTSKDIKTQLQLNEIDRSKILGAALNKTNAKHLEKYYGYGKYANYIKQTNS